MRRPCLLLPSLFILLAASALAENKILGEVELQGETKIERDSGVWVDGQYLGYLKELKGSKKVLLLPGQHEIIARQDGYEDFGIKITLQPGEKQLVIVKMARGSAVPDAFSDG